VGHTGIARCISCHEMGLPEKPPPLSVSVGGGSMSLKGVVCGVRVEDIEEPTMQEIRYLDKLIDELAKGKAMEKILRK